jgi:hypothetical protein
MSTADFMNVACRTASLYDMLAAFVVAMEMKPLSDLTDLQTRLVQSGLLQSVALVKGWSVTLQLEALSWERLRPLSEPERARYFARRILQLKATPLPQPSGTCGRCDLLIEQAANLDTLSALLWAQNRLKRMLDECLAILPLLGTWSLMFQDDSCATFMDRLRKWLALIAAETAKHRARL